MTSVLRAIKNVQSSKSFAALGEWYHDKMSYRKMGLRYDDLIPDENDLVKTALSRLPKREQYDRQFRFKRALHYSMLHDQLPKEEWTKPEEDIPVLRNMIAEVEAEELEKSYFDQLTTIPANLTRRNRVAA